MMGATAVAPLLDSSVRRRSSMVEHVICNLEVTGSSPVGGFRLWNDHEGHH